MRCGAVCGLSPTPNWRYDAAMATNRLRAGMVGVGMIFEDTYWPFFAQAHALPLYQRAFGAVEVDLAALASL